MQSRTPAYPGRCTSFERFAGHEEPIDPIAGHIPGAQCLPPTTWLQTVVLRHLISWQSDLPSTRIPAALCYCGSGVTATHNILAARLAGRGTRAVR